MAQEIMNGTHNSVIYAGCLCVKGAQSTRADTTAAKGIVFFLHINVHAQFICMVCKINENGLCAWLSATNVPCIVHEWIVNTFGMQGKRENQYILHWTQLLPLSLTLRLSCSLSLFPFPFFCLGPSPSPFIIYVYLCCITFDRAATQTKTPKKKTAWIMLPYFIQLETMHKKCNLKLRENQEWKIYNCKPFLWCILNVRPLVLNNRSKTARAHTQTHTKENKIKWHQEQYPRCYGTSVWHYDTSNHATPSKDEWMKVNMDARQAGR